MEKIELVDLKRQYIKYKSEIDTAIQKVIDDTAFISGKYSRKFEQQFADYLNVKHCIGMSNGTDSLFIALRVLDIKRSDEVLLPVNTFIATAEAVCNCGATPVFVDVDKKTYNIDILAAEKKITEKTKAIMPVHLYGQPADMNAVIKLAEKYNLRIVEDAAQAHGALFENRKVATFGEFGSFSFYPGKNLGAYGDAGALVTNDDNLAERARKFIDHGRVDKYKHQIIGYNHRFDGIQAAVLSVKLKYLEEWNARRNQIAEIYNKNIDDTKYIKPFIASNVKSAYHLYVLQTKKLSRDIIIEKLNAANICAGIHYPIPLHRQPAFANYKFNETTDFLVADELATKIFSIPMHPDLTDEEALYICKVLNEL